MADEENPLGGGPFGVGPFGPLVGTVAAAAAAFSMVMVSSSAPLTRTLYYQALITPPPTATLAAAAFEPAPGKWMPRWTGPPKYQPNRGPFAAYLPAEPPAPPVVVDTIDAGSEVVTARASSKTLFYQSVVRPIYTPVEVVVTATPDQWMPRWQGAVRQAWPVKQLAPFVPREATLENSIGSMAWTQPWRGPPAYHPAPAGGAPFVPKEAVRENTVTPDAWMPRWQKAVLPSRPIHTQPAFGYPYEAAVVSNLTTTLEWMPAWSGTKRPLLSLAGGVVNVPIPSNLTTTLEWQVAWRGPPRSTPAPQGGQPFVPKEATLENTLTGIPWLQRWQGAVPVPPVHHTQPVFGYPYEAASNLTTTLEWLQRWQGPPRYWPIKVQALPFVPKADVVDQVTPDKWLIRWQGPPRYLIPLPGGSPFVAKEAVLENTVTPDKWLVRFAKAVPVPKPVPTQPEFRYPYETQAIVVPYEQWWHQPLSRAPARPAVHAKPYQPFVPREAVAENTQTPDKWLQRWQGPPHITPIKVQTPPFVPKEAVAENTQTPDKWHRDLGRAVAKRPVTPTQPSFVYVPPAAITLTTTLEWQQPLSVAARGTKAKPTQPIYAHIVPPAVVAEEINAGVSITTALKLRKTLFYQAKVQAPYPYEQVFVDNTVTIDKWQQPLRTKAAPRPPVHRGLWTFGYPYEQIVEVCIPAFQVQDAFQFDAFQTCAEEQPPPLDLGGPADEPERVACVRRNSRVAVVPEVLRVATVPVDLRISTVPELSRTVVVLFSDRDEDANQFTTLPCVEPITADAFDDGFQDNGFQ